MSADIGYEARVPDVALDGGAGRANGAGANLSIETLLSMLRATRPGFAHVTSPLGVFTAWAKQTGDVSWDDVTPAHELIVFPLTDYLLGAADKGAFGHQVPWVGILADRPAKPGIVEDAFNGAPYELLETEAVYRQGDSRPVPRGYILYWAKLRAGVDGGRESMTAVAKRLGGRLVFPHEVPRWQRARPRPMMRFSEAIAYQQEVGVASSLGKVIAVSGIADEGANTARNMLIGLGVLSVAGFIFWGTLQPPRRRR